MNNRKEVFKLNDNMKYDLDKLFADDPEMLKILNEISLTDIESPSVTQPTVNTVINSVPITSYTASPALQQSEVHVPKKVPSLDEILAELNAELGLETQRSSVVQEQQWQPTTQISQPTETFMPTDRASSNTPSQHETPYWWETDARPKANISDVKPQTTGRKFGRIIFNAMFYCLIIAILAGAAMFTFSGNTQKSYFGYRLYTVKTPSMTPQAGGPSGGFRVGDTILVKLCDPETVQPGDVITFTPGSDPNVYLTHRVEKVLNHLNEDQGLFFVTKGDANPSEDPPIAAKAVIGKVVAVIPGAGGIIEFVRSNFVLCLISIAAAIGSIILLRMYFSGPDKKVNNMARENQCSVTAT